MKYPLFKCKNMGHNEPTPIDAPIGKNMLWALLERNLIKHWLGYWLV
jgi:hypothetical protein